MVKIIKDDLFKNDKDRVPVHCISSDYVMGAGIAVPMAKKYDLHNALKGISSKIQDVIYVNGVLNMITKEKVYQKPTLENFERTLENVRNVCIRENIKKIVMPRIGCGLDGLEWTTVLGLIEDIFSGDTIDVLVCDYSFKKGL